MFLMQVERIKSLVDFLRSGSQTLDSLIKFVSIDTLHDFEVVTVFLNVVRFDGSVYIPAGYGYTPEAFAKIPDRYVSVDTPVNRALHTGRIVECGDFNSYLFAGPEYPEELFPNGFAFSFAWPIPGVGTVVTFCRKVTELTPEIQRFLLTIGGILSLEIRRSKMGDEIQRNEVHHTSVAPSALTPRQWTIVGAIRRGMTNPAIAEDLGFSQSLIRQETMHIYRKLRISGRRELIESDLNLDPIESTSA